MVPATSSSPAIRVLVVNSIRIQKLVVGTSPSSYTAGPALAILASGDITVTGLLGLSPSAGVFDAPGCKGSDGSYNNSCVDIVSGPGGGANASNGAKGGDIAGYIGGAGGIASGTFSVVPLRGGCSGGGSDGPEGVYSSGGFGGGALQPVSSGRIVIDGIVDVRGGDGEADRYSQDTGYFITGGGAGGAALLEAPEVDLGPNGQILAAGGRGAGLCSSATSYCGVSGSGSHSGIAAKRGEALGRKRVETRHCVPARRVLDIGIHAAVEVHHDDRAQPSPGRRPGHSDQVRAGSPRARSSRPSIGGPRLHGRGRRAGRTRPSPRSRHSPARNRDGLAAGFA